MVKDISIFVSCRFATRYCSRIRWHYTHSHIALSQRCCTIIVIEGHLVFRRRFFFPSSGIGCITRYSGDSRTPNEGVTDLGWRILADWNVIMFEEVTFNFHTTFLQEDNGVFALLLFVCCRVGNILRYRSKCRSPTGEVIGVVDIRLTSWVSAKELGHSAVSHLVTFDIDIVFVFGLDNGAVPVFPSDGEAFLLPFAPIWIRLVRIIYPLIVGIILRMDTMIEIILLFYFPPLALTNSIHKDEETSCTSSVTKCMVSVTFYSY